MTALLIIVIAIMCFIILNSNENVLNELRQVKERQDTLYTAVLGKVNSIKKEMEKMKNACIESAKGFQAHSDAELACMKDLQEILTQMLTAIDAIDEEMGSVLCEEPEPENDDQEKEDV